MVRGNVGTGFKAPTLDDLHKGDRFSLSDVYDPFVDRTKLNTEVEVVTAGNKNLEEEKSLGATIGFMAEPLNGLNLSTDYWYVKIDQKVTELDLQDVLDAEAEGKTYDGVILTRAGDGTLERAVLPIMNLGELEQSGVDVSLNYAFQAGGHSIGLGSEYSRLFYSRSVLFPGKPVEDTLGHEGEPAWRAVNTLSWAPTRAHGFTLRNNIIAQHATQERTDLAYKVGSFTTYDVQYAWNHPWNGKIAVGSLNVLNTPFPQDQTQRAGDNRRRQELYTPDGRVLYVKATQVF